MKPRVQLFLLKAILTFCDFRCLNEIVFDKQTRRVIDRMYKQRSSWKRSHCFGMECISSETNEQSKIWLSICCDIFHYFKLLENLKQIQSSGHDEISKKVISSFKNGDKYRPECYQPISLLTAMSKIFRKLLLKRMSTFVTKHKILSIDQFGFRKNYNCTNATTELTENIRQEIGKRNRGYVCFIDLKKAFNSMDHGLLLLLLAKLELYGFPGTHFPSYPKLFTEAQSVCLP